MNDLTSVQFDSINPRSLNLIILPTEKCNFRCTYCYEHFDKGVINAETVEGIKNLVDRRLYELDDLSIWWFGGEPLIAKSVIYDLMSFFDQKAIDNPQLTLSSHMTTNGYFLDLDALKTLTNLGVFGYQITLDGYEDEHNATRRLNGRNYGTFTRIWENLLAAKQSDLSFSIVLRLHYSPENEHKIENLIPHINTNFGGDSRFEVHIHPVSRLGGKNDDTLKLYKSYSDQLSAKRRLSSMVDSVKISDAVDLNYICYAARPNSIIVRSDGTLGKCTVALYDEKNSVGKINRRGDLIIDPNISVWVDSIFSDDKKFLACPWRSIRSRH